MRFQQILGIVVQMRRLVEILPSVMGVQHTLKHLKKWMKPSRRQVSILFQPAQAYVMYQPLRCCRYYCTVELPIIFSRWSVMPSIGRRQSGHAENE